MNKQELRQIIKEEINKVLNKEELQWAGGPGGQRLWKDDEHYYTVVTDPNTGQYKFLVLDKNKNKKVSYLVKSEFKKIKSSPYYEAYKEVRDNWNPNEYGSENSLFGY